MSWPADALLLADTSAWTRAARFADEWRAAFVEERIVRCAVIDLEVLHHARSRREVDDVDGELSLLRDLPISRGTMAAARRAVLDLATSGADGAHRVPAPDAIVAACAAEHGAAVLHYDAHYDRLAGVLGFRSVWAAPAGSIA